MSYFTKIRNRAKNLFSSPRFLTTFLLLIVIAFIFNFNEQIFRVGASVTSSVFGEGHSGYLPKWIYGTTCDASVPASSSLLYTGGSSTITWSSNNATSCDGTNFDTGGATSGSATVNPISTTTYTVTCTGDTNSVACIGDPSVQSITVTVKKRPQYIEN